MNSKRRAKVTFSHFRIFTFSNLHFSFARSREEIKVEEEESFVQLRVLDV